MFLHVSEKSAIVPQNYQNSAWSFSTEAKKDLLGKKRTNWVEKVSDRHTQRGSETGKKCFWCTWRGGFEWEGTLLSAWNVIYCLRMCWEWSPETRKLAPSAPSRCLITSHRQAHVAVDCHSFSGSWSEWCLFVCPSAAGLISSTNDSAGSSQMSDITPPRSKPKDVSPCFISWLSDDAALISFFLCQLSLRPVLLPPFSCAQLHPVLVSRHSDPPALLLCPP